MSLEKLHFVRDLPLCVKVALFEAIIKVKRTGCLRLFYNNRISICCDMIFFEWSLLHLSCVKKNMFGYSINTVKMNLNQNEQNVLWEDKIPRHSLHQPYFPWCCKLMGTELFGLLKSIGFFPSWNNASKRNRYCLYNSRDLKQGWIKKSLQKRCIIQQSQYHDNDVMIWNRTYL